MELLKEKSLTEDLNYIIDKILYSYETRINSIASILDSAPQILQEVQDVLIDTKKEGEKISAELRESLAKNKSLRKKDFDNMMHGILFTQNEREKEVRNLLNFYLNEQKEMAQALKENLRNFKDSLVKREFQRVKEFQEMIRVILSKQDKRKEEVSSRLKEFQSEQRIIAGRLRELLAKGRELRIRDLKSMLKEFKAGHNERRTFQEERREMVRRLLDVYKKKGTASVENWKDGKKNFQEEANSFENNHSVRNNPRGQNTFPLMELSNEVHIDASKKGAKK
jgi:hypothetical protein